MTLPGHYLDIYSCLTTLDLLLNCQPLHSPSSSLAHLFFFSILLVLFFVFTFLSFALSLFTCSLAVRLSYFILLLFKIKIKLVFMRIYAFFLQMITVSILLPPFSSMWQVERNLRLISSLELLFVLIFLSRPFY